MAYTKEKKTKTKKPEPINIISKIINKHINNRFKELDKILSSSKEVHVRFPGNNETKEHALGTGLAIHQWQILDTNLDEYNKTIQNITLKINNLLKKYSNQIDFGSVGFNIKNDTFGKRPKKNPTPNYIHVWGANSHNWNYSQGYKNPNGFGGGQASKITAQIPGVFGIVTTPFRINLNDIEAWSEKVLEKSKTKHIK